MSTIRFSSFGVLAQIVAPAELVASIETVLPPGRRSLPAGHEADIRLTVEAVGVGRYAAQGTEGQPLTADSEETALLDLLDSHLRRQVAQRAPDHVFIHAAAAAVGGRLVVLPGRSFTGKSTLIQALLAEGAEYYSDEYAVLDAAGRVHPYPRHISVRIPGALHTTEVDPRSLGATIGTEPLAPSLVVATKYQPGGDWQPRSASRGSGALALLDNAVVARERPEAVLFAVKLAVEQVRVVRGTRGEAVNVARWIVDALTNWTTPG